MSTSSTREWPVNIVQLAPGPLTASTERWSFGRSEYTAMSFTHGVQMRIRVRNRALIGHLIHGTAAVTANGMPLSPGDITVSRDTVLDISSLGPFAFMCVQPSDHIPAVRGSTVFTGSLAAAVTAPGAHPETPWAVRRMSDIDLGSIVRHAKRLPNSIAARRRHELACRVEALVWPKIDEPISLRYLGEIAGCSKRTVIYAFKKSFGLGPICYFKLRRLNAVREQLFSPATRRAIVYIAADYGFWHLGHFGQDYKELFGETPSQTRRHARLQEKRLASTDLVESFGQAHRSESARIAPSAVGDSLIPAYP